MVLPTVMFYFGVVYLTLDILRACGFRAPFRISSTPKGAVMPTALYVLIEDVVAVDGGGGQMYRYALRTRYLSSPYFRRMLVQMNYFWAGGSIIWAAAITAMIFTTPQDAAFAVSISPVAVLKFTLTSLQIGWCVPFVWAGLWTLITIPWVQSDLRREKEAWRTNGPQGGEPYVDDINAPTARTRLESIHFPRFFPQIREKSSTTSMSTA
jgi:hypothetical protein